jgi:hypothetical protein
MGQALPALVGSVPDDQAKWKPADGSWSILEVVTHLADEEVEDFRTRVRMTLESPAESWPKIDPPGWAVERRYNEGNLPAALDRFVSERSASIAWLRGLAGPDWSSAYEHPKFGPIHAGDLLAAWAAHDALHLRQIAKRMFQLAGEYAGEYKTIYAGEWSA